MSNMKISKKSWSPEEDAHLLRLVEELGLNGHWSTISTRMGNRTGKQCRERYHNHLKPDIWKGTWSQEEDDLLNESQRTMGNQWAKIAKLLPGRSDNSVKNRWHIINRKKHSMEEPALIATATMTIKASRPVIPKLALANLSRAIPTPATLPETDFDLMSFYYSHESHSHCRNATDSTRTTRSESCPGSGRRDYTATESAPADVFDVDFDCDDDDALDSFIDTTCEVISFNNTMSSCVSELTAHSGNFRADEGSDSEYFASYEMNDAEEAAWEKSITKIHSNSNSRCDSGDEQEKLQLSIDRFSEPALSFRDMDSVLDDLAHDDYDDHEEFDENFQRGNSDFTEEDDLFFLNDLMDECTTMNTVANASPLRLLSAEKKSQMNKLVSMFQQLSNSKQQQQQQHQATKSLCNFSPRTTPRSPLCTQQQQKRQRATRTPRSPYQMLLQVL